MLQFAQHFLEFVGVDTAGVLADAYFLTELR